VDPTPTMWATSSNSSLFYFTVSMQIYMWFIKQKPWQKEKKRKGKERKD
jgi:hypothetical protein